MAIDNAALYWTEAGIDLCGEPGGSVVRERVVDSEPEAFTAFVRSKAPGAVRIRSAAHRQQGVNKTRRAHPENLTVKRRHLTQREIDRLMDCARKRGRYGHRDATMMLVAYRHGLRASEVCDLQWQQIELSGGRLHVQRVKNGIASAQGAKERPSRQWPCG